MSEINKAALQLRIASESKIACAPIRELIGESDIETAYAIQEENIKLRIAKGARAVGSKIGLTSFAVQKQLGVDQPDFGVLLDDMHIQDGATVDFNLLMQPKVEAEVAFVLAADLNGENMDESDVLSAIDYAVASIEIVGSRIDKWNIRITDTVADNASASHFVLGKNHIKVSDFDAVGCVMELLVNDEKVSEGNGAACMGSPLKAVLWLAQTMKRLGQPLKKGDIILSGALGPMAPVNPGDSVVATIEGLGSVSVKFGL